VRGWGSFVRRARLPAKLAKHEGGAAAVEFALVVVPFLFLLFGLFEIGVVYFASASFDAAVQRGARLVRTGQAQAAGMSLSEFRTAVCDGYSNLFGCESNSYFTVEVLSSLGSATYTSPVQGDGSFVSTETFDTGAASDYMIVRGFLQFAPLFDVFGALSPGLANGNRLFVSSALFRNESF